MEEVEQLLLKLLERQHHSMEEAVREEPVDRLEVPVKHIKVLIVLG